MTRDEILELIGDPAQFRREMESFDRSCQHSSQHWDEIAEKFVNRWIAIYDGALVADAPSHDELLVLLGEKGIPSAHTLTEFVFPSDVAIMLTCR